MAILDILKKKKIKQDTAAKATTEKNVLIKKQEPPQKQKTEHVSKGGKGERFSHILVRPRISEKAALQSGGNSYIFDVAQSANKIEIKKAIKEIYNVLPVKVNVLNVKPKQKIVRGVLGRTSSFKKAIVFLKDGDTIEFV